jgi:hypothetical protein
MIVIYVIVRMGISFHAENARTAARFRAA